MDKISNLRVKVGEIKKKIAKGIGIDDFKYIHSKSKQELINLINKYEKMNKGAITIQQAVKTKKAKEEARSLINKRDKRQIIRDLELKLATIKKPQEEKKIAEISLSARKKREAIANLYEEEMKPITTFELFNPSLKPIKPPTPKPPTPVFRKRRIDEFRYLPTPVKFNMRPKSANDIPPQRQKMERPTTALNPVEYRKGLQRPFNKYKPLI